MYLKSERQEGTPNKLVTAVLMGLSNKYVVAALHARSRYILNHLATRPSLYGLMKCMEGAVENLADLQPRNRLLIRKACAYEPAYWKQKIESWSACVAPYHDKLMELVRDEEFKANTIRVLSTNIAPMKESTARNWKDDDFSGDKTMKHAPVSTDHLESNFGTLGQVLHRTIAAGYRPASALP
jgi:hypothetical protein